jgi:hypothetical protein
MKKGAKEKYVEYKLKGWLDSKKLFENNVSKIDKTIIGTFKNMYDISEFEYDSMVEEFLDIQIVKAKFTKEREEGFGDIVSFYKWYKAEVKNGYKCGYCGTEAKVLEKLFDEKKLHSKKFTSTLHIERKDPNKPYSKNNCMFACSLCNNAKSDLISVSNYRQYFKDSMKNFLHDLYNDKINNIHNEN